MTGRLTLLCSSHRGVVDVPFADLLLQRTWAGHAVGFPCPTCRRLRHSPVDAVTAQVIVSRVDDYLRSDDTARVPVLVGSGGALTQMWSWLPSVQFDVDRAALQP